VRKSAAVEESMRNMIHHDHAKAIFATSYGSSIPSWSMWRNKIQKFQFFHCGGWWQPGKHPSNIGIYFGFIDEVEYLSGMVAGMTTRAPASWASLPQSPFRRYCENVTLSRWAHEEHQPLDYRSIAVHWQSGFFQSAKADASNS